VPRSPPPPARSSAGHHLLACPAPPTLLPGSYLHPTPRAAQQSAAATARLRPRPPASLQSPSGRRNSDTCISPPHSSPTSTRKESQGRRWARAGRWRRPNPPQPPLVACVYSQPPVQPLDPLRSSLAQMRNSPQLVRRPIRHASRGEGALLPRCSPSGRAGSRPSSAPAPCKSTSRRLVVQLVPPTSAHHLLK
jgi:hypothetical protein